MSFSKVSFTNAGRALQAKALTGTALVFTKIALGAGNLNGRDPATFTNLIETKVSLNISKITRAEQLATLEANFTNLDNAVGFYLREIGLFANDPILGEILYCYGNAAALAEYIPPSTSSLIEKVIKLNAVVGNAQNVSATINTSAFATKKEISDVNMSLTEVNTQLQQKANQGQMTSYVDSKVASVASGAPDRAFNTLALLKVAYPSGDSKNKLVSYQDDGITVNGHIYTWNGTVWIDTGIVYQSTRLANGAVSLENISYELQPICNIIPMWELGAINADGWLVASTTRVRTNNKIFLKTGNKIILNDTVNYNYSITRYNPLTQVFIEQIAYTTTNYIIPEDCYCIIVIRKTDDSDLTNLINTTSNQMKILPYQVKADILDDNLKRVLSRVDLPTQYTWELGAINGDGSLSTLTTRIRTSDYLSVKAGHVINIKDTVNYQFSVSRYNKLSKGFIEQITYRIESYTATEDCLVKVVIRKKDNADLSGKEAITGANLAIITAESRFVDQYKIQDETINLNKLDRKLKIKVNRQNFMHLSFDDVVFCVTNLINNKTVFTSLFQEPFFAKLKELHDVYGAIFSLYIYGNTLSGLDGTFKQEFIDNSDWLKFGLHSWQQSDYAATTAVQAKADWDAFINSIYTVAGGLNSVDRIPRLHTFAGNLESLKAMRDCNCGAIGFLSADDSRDTYYLNSNQRNYLRTHDKLYDMPNGMIFYSTDMRLDWFVSGFVSNHEYNKPLYNNPYDELVYRYGQPSMADLYTSLIVFTHEWQIYSSGYILNTDMVNRLEQVCRFAVNYGYSFDFPQNRVNGGITSLVIN